MLIQKRIISGLVIGISMAYFQTTFAATPVDLSHQTINTLKSFAVSPGVTVEEFKRDLDSNQMLHIRLQQMYMGYKIFAADAVLHIKNGKKISDSLAGALNAATLQNSLMNGTFYNNLSMDLGQVPADILNQTQLDQALQSAVLDFQKEVGHPIRFQDEKNTVIVYVDKNNKAHWAYQISFYVQQAKTDGLPAKPVYIMDALTFKIYKKWNDIQTEQSKSLNDLMCGADNIVFGGGFGGNPKSGKFTYDGLPGNLAKLAVQRECKARTCYMQNDNVNVFNINNQQVMNYHCAIHDPNHNHVYWNGEFDATNGAYSPSNDALGGATETNAMYQTLLGVPALINADGTPMVMKLYLHANMNNAYWNGAFTVYGDGDQSHFYPFVTPDVIAHEFSHGFTQQHSNLNYSGQSGGMNEAFSDIGAAAQQFYATGHNDWLIGATLFKTGNQAIRYMDKPSKDCYGDTPGNWCSIDTVSQYYDGLDVHFSSGIYNRFFYLLSTSEGWDTQKAFSVVAKANQFYWTSNETFANGACGVLNAAIEACYNEEAVIQAFASVGIDTSSCVTFKK